MAKKVTVTAMPVVVPRKYVSNGVTAEALGCRIRRMIRTKIMEPMDGEQIFDDEPNKVSKSMAVNPVYDFNNDTFDLVEDMHMTALDASNKALDKPSPVASPEAKGAEGTPTTEVNGSAT